MSYDENRYGGEVSDEMDLESVGIEWEEYAVPVPISQNAYPVIQQRFQDMGVEQYASALEVAGGYWKEAARKLNEGEMPEDTKALFHPLFGALPLELEPQATASMARDFEDEGFGREAASQLAIMLTRIPHEWELPGDEDDLRYID